MVWARGYAAGWAQGELMLGDLINTICMKKKEDGMISEEEKVGVLLFFFWKGGGRE